MPAIIIFSIMLLAFLLFYIHSTRRIQKKLTSDLAKWHKAALTDDLTQIPNRTAYSTRIQELKKYSDYKSIAIILFDIDGFKNINDIYGHLKGDKALKQCAKVLCDTFCTSDFTVYRIGGDEFAVIAQNVSENIIKEKLSDIEARKELKFRISKGYSYAKGTADFSNMFQLADKMLYADKVYK